MLEESRLSAFLGSMNWDEERARKQICRAPSHLSFHFFFFFPVGYAGAQEVLFSVSGVHAQYFFFLVVGGT